MNSNKKIYGKPALDVAIFSSDEIMATSGGIVSGDRFTKISGNEKNSVDVGNLN